MTNKEGLLNGPLWKKILMFALPLAATSFLQQLFSSADIAVLGMYESANAIASVGATIAVINLSVNLLVGLSVGATVAISHLIGGGQEDKVGTAVHSSMALALVVGILVMLVWELMGRPLLVLMGTPASILEGAVTYLEVYSLGIPFLMIFNFCAAIFRSGGDTKKPLYALIAACVVNICLNICFVKMGWGIAGVAGATVIGNLVSSVILAGFLMQHKGVFRLQPSKLCFNKEIIGKVLKVGVPAAVQGMVFSISNIVIQSALNSLGEKYIAASTVSLNYEIWAVFIILAFGQACVAYNGLFYGARNFAKCREVTRWSLGLCQLCTNAFVITILMFPNFFLGLFTTEPEIIEVAIQRLYIILGLDWISVFMDIFSGAMRGWGVSTPPAIISIFGVCVVRVIYVWTYFAGHRTFLDLLYVYPLTWAITGMAIFILYCYAKKRIMVV